MTVQAHPRPGAVARFGPIAAALAFGFFLHPLAAVAVAFGSAAVRRHDRRVLIALVVIGVLWLGFWATFAFGHGGGEGSGSTPVR